MKLNWSFLLFACICLSLAACSEDVHLPGSASFIKLYGGERLDYGVSVVQTNDGGYICLGNSYSHPEGGTGKDIYVVKTNQWGDRKWARFYGGIGEDQAKCIKPTSDGGYLILGDYEETETITKGTDYYLIKTDAEGAVLWSKSYGLAGRVEHAKSMDITAEGDIIITGNIVYDENNSEVYLIKTNPQGEIIWETTFGLLELPNEVGSSVIPLYDGGYILCGTEKGRKLGNSEDTDIRIIKINGEGAILWSYAYGGPTPQTGTDIQPFPGGFIAVGTINTTGEHTDIFLLKVDDNGKEIWSKTFGGNGNEWGTSVSTSPEGSFVICGTTESYGEGGKDIYLLKADSEGNELWSETYGGSRDDEGSKVIVAKDGGLVITGTIGFDETNTMVGLLKTDANGQLSR